MAQSGPPSPRDRRAICASSSAGHELPGGTLPDPRQMLQMRAANERATMSPMKLILPVALCASLFACPGLAEEEDVSQFGTTNPDEMTWQSFRQRAADGESDMVLCSMGYMMTKSGDHETARILFETCANDGYTGAMTWMSQLDNNGLGAEYNPEASAEWDRRAADAGDPVGQFNHGLNLMRGHGIKQDQARGRHLVDQAAAAGLPVAKRLQGAGYELDEVTPDADNWKYAPAF